MKKKKAFFYQNTWCCWECSLSCKHKKMILGYWHTRFHFQGKHFPSGTHLCRSKSIRCPRSPGRTHTGIQRVNGGKGHDCGRQGHTTHSVVNKFHWGPLCHSNMSRHEPRGSWYTLRRTDIWYLRECTHPHPHRRSHRLQNPADRSKCSPQWSLCKGPVGGRYL